MYVPDMLPSKHPFAAGVIRFLEHDKMPPIPFSFVRTCSADLSGLAAEHGEVAIFGIGRELPFTMAAWSEGMGLSYPLLSDPNLEVSKVNTGVHCCNFAGKSVNFVCCYVPTLWDVMEFDLQDEMIGSTTLRSTCMCLQ